MYMNFIILLTRADSIWFVRTHPAVSAKNSFCLSSQKVAATYSFFYNGDVIIDQTIK